MGLFRFPRNLRLRLESEEEGGQEELAIVPFVRASTPFSAKPENSSSSPRVSAVDLKSADLIPAVRGKTPADIVGEANAVKSFGAAPHLTVTFDSISSASFKPQRGVLKTRVLPPPAPSSFKISRERAGSVPPSSSTQFVVGRRFTRATSVPADTNLSLVRHSSKPNNFWFESSSMEPIPSPPDLSSRPDLQLGDIFYHKCPSGPQLWIWKCQSGSSVARWHPVSVGYEREDGKKLHLTPINERPQWISSDWHARQMREKRGKK
ncbi:hypothetical protein BDY19DRAFT_992898 [Irpex rosettiformis]|uniref:Uncharacterized protein n=1 Tax=Irpex rosettiformis TaxID=378272 RepID=A0ACB8U6V5_9APHY|nr:hypothetical protein BDY19DRAFT_992898 [Irpex rosettiformis]